MKMSVEWTQFVSRSVPTAIWYDSSHEFSLTFVSCLLPVRLFISVTAYSEHLIFVETSTGARVTHSPYSPRKGQDYSFAPYFLALIMHRNASVLLLVMDGLQLKDIALLRDDYYGPLFSADNFAIFSWHFVKFCGSLRQSRTNSAAHLQASCYLVSQSLSECGTVVNIFGLLTII